MARQMFLAQDKDVIVAHLTYPEEMKGTSLEDFGNDMVNNNDAAASIIHYGNLSEYAKERILEASKLDEGVRPTEDDLVQIVWNKDLGPTVRMTNANDYELKSVFASCGDAPDTDVILKDIYAQQIAEHEKKVSRSKMADELCSDIDTSDLEQSGIESLPSDVIS